MGDENKIRDAADAIKGVVEAVPVYQDVLQPAAKEIGTGLQTVAKLVHVALSPVSVVVWGYEQIRDYLQDTLTQKLKNIPPEQIAQPKLTIAGPVVEQLRFAADEPCLRELYSNLLATSMDARKSGEAHPAFIEVIRQLTQDEAQLIDFLAKFTHEIHLYLNGNLQTMLTQKGIHMSGPNIKLDLSNTLGVSAGCSHVHLIESYLDNLRRLGLVQTTTNWTYTNFGSLSNDVRDETVWPTIRHHIRVIEDEGGDDYEYNYFYDGSMTNISFTAFGTQFCRACVFAPEA